MYLREQLLFQRISNDALELTAKGVGHELLDVHHRHIVFAGEPVADLTTQKSLPHGKLLQYYINKRT